MSYLGLNAPYSAFLRRDADSAPTKDGTITLGSPSFKFEDIISLEFTALGTGANTMPAGTTLDRPNTPAQGMLRYNSDLSSFEGHNGGQWVGLGGVVDVDQDTYISAENSPGADNDQIRLYTAGTERLRVNSNGVVEVFNDISLQDSNPSLRIQATSPSENIHLWFQNSTGTAEALLYHEWTQDQLIMQEYTANGSNLAATIQLRQDGIMQFYTGGVDGVNATLNMQQAASGGILYNNWTTTGSHTITGTLSTSAIVANAGTGGTFYGDWNLAGGATLEATYADIAERYAVDNEVEPGDIVELGGEAEVTKTTTYGSTDVFGVVSTAPAFKMNGNAGSDKTHPFIALSGRVPVKVKGVVKKGDRIISSDTAGIGKVGFLSEITVWQVIGRALEDNNNEEVKLVEVAVGKN